MANIFKMFANNRAAMDVVGVVVDVVLVTALIPVIATFISNATNLSATEAALLYKTLRDFIELRTYRFVYNFGADYVYC